MLPYPKILTWSEPKLDELIQQIAWAGVTNRDTKVTRNRIHLGYFSRGTPETWDIDQPTKSQIQGEIDRFALSLKKELFAKLNSDQENGPSKAEEWLKDKIKLRDRWVKEIRQRFLEVRQVQHEVDQQLVRCIARAETIKFYSEVALMTLSIFPTGGTVLISCGSVAVKGAGKVLVARLAMPLGYGIFANVMDPRTSWTGADSVALATNTAKSIPGALTEQAPGNVLVHQVQQHTEMANHAKQVAAKSSRETAQKTVSAMADPKLSPKGRFDVIWKELAQNEQVRTQTSAKSMQHSAHATQTTRLYRVLTNPATQGALGALSVYFWRQSLIDASNNYLKKMDL